MKYPKIRIKILKDLSNNPKNSYAYKISQRLSVNYSRVYIEIKNMLIDKLVHISKAELNQNPRQHIKHYKLTSEGKHLARLYLEIDQVYLNLSPLKDYKKHL